MAKRRLSVEIVGDADKLDKTYKQSADGADQFERRTSKAVQGAKESTDKFGDSIQDMRGKFDGWGKDLAIGLGAGAGALAAGLFVKGFSDAMDREQSNSKLAVQLGLSPEMAKAAGELAGDVYVEGFGESFDDANQAVRSIAQNMGGFGDLTQEQLKEMTKGVLTLSEAFDEDLNEVTAAAGTLIKNGIARDGKEALDILTKGLQSPANKAGDLLDTFTEYSTQFRQLGLDGPTALGLLSQGLQGGARDADTVADALKEFVILGQEAIDPTSKAAVAFGLLGLNATDMAQRIAQGGPPAQEALQMTLQAIAAIEDPARRSQVEVALFGTKAEDLQGALGSLDTTTAVAQIGAVEGSMANATAATDTNKASLEAWKRSVEESVTNWIVETGAPTLQGWWSDWEYGTGTIGRFRDGCRQLGDGLRFLKDDVIDPTVGSLQSLNNWLTNVGNNPALSMLANISGPATSALAGSGDSNSAFQNLAKIAGPLSGIFFGGEFDTGGVIPGRRGAPQLVVAHGGEAVLPLHNMGLTDALDSVLGLGVPSLPSGGTRPGGDQFYVFNGPVMGEQDFVQKIRSGNYQAARYGRAA